jgi:hypothetical protein
VQLQALYAVDRAALTVILNNDNVVFRANNGAALVARNDEIILALADVALIVGRAVALQAGVSAEAGYRVLLNDIRDAYAVQGAYRRRLAVLQALPLNPTLNIGVAGLVGAGHPALVGSIVNWSGGAGGVIPNTIFAPAAFGGHPVDPRWEIRIPPIPGWNAALIADPFAVPHDLLVSGSIPVTPHGAHNLPAARTTYINALHRAGYV